jgi:hypothetical protein
VREQLSMPVYPSYDFIDVLARGQDGRRHEAAA